MHSWSWKCYTQLTVIENWPKQVNPHFMKSLLCAIFIVIASESCTRNWILFNLKGTLVLLVFNLVQEMSNIERLWLALLMLLLYYFREVVVHSCVFCCTTLEKLRLCSSINASKTKLLSFNRLRRRLFVFFQAWLILATRRITHFPLT